MAGAREHPVHGLHLLNAAHQVAGAVCFIKSRIELLVMTKYLIFLIIFNMPAHNNNGLPHQEHKKSAQEVLR